MTALGINSSDRDPQVGWEMITHVTRGVPPDLIQARLDADKAWQMAKETGERWDNGETTRQAWEFQIDQANEYERRYWDLYKQVNYLLGAPSPDNTHILSEQVISLTNSNTGPGDPAK